MFEDCNSLAELNAERARLSRTVPLMELNNEYNNRRKFILNSRHSYKKLKRTEIKASDATPVSYLMIAGNSPDPNIISYDANGFYIY